MLTLTKPQSFPKPITKASSNVYYSYHDDKGPVCLLVVSIYGLYSCNDDNKGLAISLIYSYGSYLRVGIANVWFFRLICWSSWMIWQRQTAELWPQPSTVNIHHSSRTESFLWYMQCRDLSFPKILSFLINSSIKMICVRNSKKPHRTGIITITSPRQQNLQYLIMDKITWNNREKSMFWLSFLSCQHGIFR